MIAVSSSAVVRKKCSFLFSPALNPFCASATNTLALKAITFTRYRYRRRRLHVERQREADRFFSCGRSKKIYTRGAEPSREERRGDHRGLMRAERGE